MKVTESKKRKVINKSAHGKITNFITSSRNQTRSGFSFRLPHSHRKVRQDNSRSERRKTNNTKIVNNSSRVFSRFRNVLKVGETFRSTSHCAGSINTFDDNITIRNFNYNKLKSLYRFQKKDRSVMSGKSLENLETAQNFILIIDWRLQIQSVSRNVSRYLGYKQADMLGHSIETFVHPSHLLEMTTFVRHGQLKTDRENSFLSWIRRRRLCVSMKYSVRKRESHSRNIGYMKVMWNVNVRLKKRRRGFRVIGAVVVCRPVRSDPVLTFSTNGNVPIRSLGFKLRFLVCNPRLSDTEQKSSQDKGVVYGINRHNFNSAKTLQYISFMESTLLSKIMSLEALKIENNQLMELMHGHPVVACGAFPKSIKQICLPRIFDIINDNIPIKTLARKIRKVSENLCSDHVISPNAGFHLNFSENQANSFQTSPLFRGISEGQSNHENHLQKDEAESTPKSCILDSRLPIDVDNNQQQQHTSQPRHEAVSCWTQMVDLTDLCELKGDTEYPPETALHELNLHELRVPDSLNQEDSNMECNTSVCVQAMSDRVPESNKMRKSSEMFTMQKNIQNKGSDCNKSVHKAYSTLPTANNSCTRTYPDTIEESEAAHLQDSSQAFSSTGFHLSAQTDGISLSRPRQSPSGFRNHRMMKNSQNKVDINITSASIVTQAKVPISDYQTHQNSSSKMTNKKSDPFLSQTSVTESSTLPDVDMFHELSSEVFPISSCPFSSQSVPTAQPMFSDISLIKPNLFPTTSCQSFMDLSSSLSDSAFSFDNMNELDSFLDAVPCNVCPTTSVTTTEATQLTPTAEKPELVTGTTTKFNRNHSSDPGPESNETCDSETHVRASLLRSLLDKGAADIQTPQSYLKWKLEHLSKKICDVKKTKMSNRFTNGRLSGSKRVKDSKSPLRKTTELPLLKTALGCRMKFGRSSYHFKRPTKELPLPPSINITEVKMSLSPSRSTFLTTGRNQIEPETDVQISNNCSSAQSGSDSSFPDDLLDMALEYCTPLGADNPETILSNLKESTPWEDNLYSLIESSVKDRPANSSIESSVKDRPANSSIESSVKDKPANSSIESSVKEKPTNSRIYQSQQNVAQSSLLKPSSSTSSSNRFQTQGNCSPRSLLFSLFSDHNLDKTITSGARKLQTEIEKSKPESSMLKTPLSPSQGHQPNTRCQFGSLPSNWSSESSNHKEKLSSLHAAITSPNVDKFRESFLLRNIKEPIHVLSVKATELKRDADMVINLPDNPIPPTAQLSSATCTHTSQIRDNMSAMKPFGINKIQDNMSIFKSASDQNIRAASYNEETAQSDHVNKSKVLASPFNTEQLVMSSNSATRSHIETNNASPNKDPPVFTVYLNEDSPSSVISTNKATKRNSKQLKHSSSQISHKSHSTYTSPKSASTANSELYSAKPVSVVVMRKESHRSRRTRSISVQTDNDPNEVYPEFELSSSDTILYPSVIVVSHNPPPHCATPTLSVTLSQPARTSELQKILLGHMSDDNTSSSMSDSVTSSSSSDISRTSSTSCEDEPQTITSTPFLLKLLTGELSKDHYQLLDKQLLDKERRYVP